MPSVTSTHRLRLRSRLTATALAGLLVAAVSAATPSSSGAADNPDVLDTSFGGSFSSGNAYTSATGEVVDGTLTRRSGAETLDPATGLVLDGGQDAVTFAPTTDFGTGTLDRSFVAEIEYTPGEGQPDLTTVLAGGGNLSVRYSGGQLQYGFSAQVDGSWRNAFTSVPAPAPDQPHIIGIAYEVHGDGATLHTFVDGKQQPVVGLDTGHAAVAGGGTATFGLGNDVHPAAQGRGLSGTVRRARLAPFDGPFTPTLLRYAPVTYHDTVVDVAFQGTIDDTTYTPEIGETAGGLLVDGGTVPTPGRLELDGPGAVVRHAAGGLDTGALDSGMLAETVVAPDTLTGGVLIDLLGVVRLEAVGGGDVRLVTDAGARTFRLPEPSVQDGLAYHHLAVRTAGDDTGTAVQVLVGNEPLGEPLAVGSLTPRHSDVRWLADVSGVAYGVGLTEFSGDAPAGVLAGLPCTVPDVEPASQLPIHAGECVTSLTAKASALRPSQRQLDWQRAEKTAFLHYGVNTYTGLEWGHGDEDPDLFQPTGLDTDQWARTLRDNGFRIAVLTVKHHDGFLLYPSRYTDHHVGSSSWRDGEGDVLRSFVDSMHRYGIKVGVYLSPADENQYLDGVYANGSPVREHTIPTLVPEDDRVDQDLPTFELPATDYGAFMLNQLYEVLTEYGPIDEVWFDGAQGRIPSGDVENYDFTSWYGLIRELAPQASIAVAGPDVRWVGNESGLAREDEWSTVPTTTSELGRRGYALGYAASDQGSRSALVRARDNGATHLSWWPAEADVSIRPGWFWHETQQPKRVDQLMDIYERSVGRNSVLLLNVPPDREGKLDARDVARLDEWSNALAHAMPVDLAIGADATSGDAVSGDAGHVTDGDIDTAWTAPASGTGTVTIDLGEARRVDRISVSENIRAGMQVERFTVDALVNDAWVEVAGAGSIGHKRILVLDEAVTARQWRITVLESRAPAQIAAFSLFGSVPLDQPVPPRDRRTWYVDCSAERAGTGTRARPFDSLAQLRALDFGPGTRILLRAGTRCTGELEIWGYGSADTPSLIGTYGGRGVALIMSRDAANESAADDLRRRGWEIGRVLIRDIGPSR